MTVALREIISFENGNTAKTQNTNMLIVWPCYTLVLEFDQTD